MHICAYVLCCSACWLPSSLRRGQGRDPFRAMSVVVQASRGHGHSFHTIAVFAIFNSEPYTRLSSPQSVTWLYAPPPRPPTPRSVDEKVAGQTRHAAALLASWIGTASSSERNSST